jgi:hypothetical protein
LTRLASCIDRGLNVVQASLTHVKAYVQDLQAVDRTLRPNDETTGEEREAQFILRRQEWESSTDPMHQVVYLSPADKYHRLTRRLSKEQKVL